MSHSVSNVSRTAFDSLRAKHSSMCRATYPVLSPFPVECSRHGPNNTAAADGHNEEIVEEPQEEQQQQHRHNVSALEDSYRQLLNSMADRLEGVGRGQQGRNRPRQTPLVNAGYAMRASTILSTILNFVRYHEIEFRHDNEEHAGPEESQRSFSVDVQIVVLGAGLDVTGLWSMMAAAGGPSTAVRVVEVDTREVCRIKASAINGMEELEVNESGIQTQSPLESCQDGFVVSAVPRNRHDCLSSSYVLLELDLTEPLETVERVMSRWVKNDVPTLFVFELVLAYLGDGPVDRLIRWLNDKYVHRFATGALVAFEPLGPPESQQVGDTIVTSYRVSYYQQFSSKMGRGTQMDSNDDEETRAQRGTFQPMGFSCRDVESRLQRLGYAKSHACLAGTAVDSLFPQGHWTSREAFDEHAALALHLRSYVVVCGFGSRSPPEFRQLMCPWITDGCPPVSTSLLVNGVTQRVWLSKVNHRSEEESIRHLFLETYRDLTAAHPSIRKMVKAAMKTDLASSQIHSHYRRNGGFFLVAKIPKEYRVLGAIGLRRLGGDEVRARGWPTECSSVFEIHRLMVDASMRRQGIATLLLDRAKDLIVWFHASSFRLVATTPAILEEANRFYASHGFSVERSTTIGELRLVTHVALVHG